MSILALSFLQIKEDFLAWLERLWNFVVENPGILLICAVLAIIPAIFWFFLYLRRVSMDKAHRKLMRRTFFIGMLSVLPVLMFDYFMVHVFNFDLNYFIRENTMNRSFALVFLGYIIVGSLEEYSKSVVVKEVDFKQRTFNRIVDGIEFAVAAALGFAFIENIVYFVSAINVYTVSSPDFIQIVVIRSLFSMLAHTLFSGMFGYYYGRAKFAGIPTAEEDKKIFALQLHKGLRIRFHRVKHLVLNQQNIHLHRNFAGLLKEEELIAEGLLIAILFHAFFNFFLGIGLTFLIVPLILIEYGIIWHELSVHKNLEIHQT